MRRLALVLPMLALTSCSQSGTYALVKFDAVGVAPSGVKSIALQLMLGSASTSTTINGKSGDITLPSSASLQIRSGSGTLQINASALDDAGNVIGTGSGSGVIKAGTTTEVDISFVFSTPGGPVLQIDHQPSFDFGTVPLTTQSSAATFTVSNTGGDVSGMIAAATLVGSGAGEFQIMNDGCVGMTLVPTATCTISVIMAPTQAGKPTATLGVSAAPGGSTSTMLTGNALALGNISITPSPANFGTALLPSGSSDQTLTVTNTGGTGTGAITMSINGSDMTQFSITGGTCANGMMLAAGASCTATVHFLPTSAGSKTASFQVDATPGGPGVANLTGIGQSPAMLAFSMGTYTVPGNVATGSTGTVTMTLLNQGTQDSGPLPALGLTGDSSLAITGGTCMQGNVVAASSSCTIIVTFTPLSYGQVTASISLGASPGGTATANVTGTGQQTFTLTVNKNGSSGNGVVSSPSQPGDINCDTANTKCTMTYTVTTTVPAVTLHAAPDATSVFSGWSASNDCAAYGTGDCQLTMSANKVATALFTAQVTLSVSFAGAGAGTVVINPGNTTCTAPTSCQVTVNSGSSVTLTAKTNNGSNSVVSGWTGACGGNGPVHSCSLTLSAPASTTVTFSTLPANLVFVTSQTYTGALGGAAGGTAKCNSLATTAGINNAAGNAYIAWLGAAGNNPVTSLGSSRGWVRADLLPWIDNMSTAISTGIVYYPAAFDENGNRVFGSTLSGMNDSSVATGYTCTDWTVGDASVNTYHGHTHACGLHWDYDNAGISACNNPSRLLCVMNGGTTPVSPTAVPGKKVWLSNSAWAPGGGIGSANTKCLTDAPAGVTAAKAILVASTQPLTSVLGATTVYVRPDGVRVGTGNEIISALNNTFAPASIEGGIIQDGAGAYIAGNYTTIEQVWSGVTYNGTADKDTCRDWTSVAPGDSGTIGADTGWVVAGKDGSFPCNTSPIFLRCAEQ